MGCLTLVTTYLMVRALRIDALWVKMMAVEGVWFARASYVVFGVFLTSLVLIRRSMFSNPLISASVGGVAGYITGILASIIAGHVRGGTLFRFSVLLEHPASQLAAELMTGTWLVGIISLLILHCIWKIVFVVGRKMNHRRHG